MKQSNVHKKATKLYAAELKKLEKEKKLLDRQVSALVYGEFGVETHK